ncbi:hypothetical protein EMIT0210MI2_12247 [Priestia megaterium]
MKQLSLYASYTSTETIGSLMLLAAGFPVAWPTFAATTDYPYKKDAG